MHLTDEVADVVFRNEENGYSVLKLAASNVTAVGFFPYVSVGQEFEFIGEYIDNAKYGKQFKVTSYEIKPPDTPSKIRQFIGSGLIEGIGPVTAANIVKTFGKDSLAVMEHRPEELIVIKGINLRKAKIIAERWAEIKDMQKSVSFLQRFDISLNMAIKIFNYYKDATIEKVQLNPYQLIETIDGIGFLTADKIAKELGISYAGRFRVRAGIVYVLKQASEAEGHTCLPMDKLLSETCRLLKIKMEQLRPVFDDVVKELCLDKYLTQAKNKSTEGVMLTSFYNAERAVATKLCVLASGVQPSSVHKQLTELLKHYEKLNNIELHPTQKEAIISAVTCGVSVITGGPGTGKTTIVRAILYINDAQDASTMLLAPTGRAAKRLEEATGMAASTIHRALLIDQKAWNYDERSEEQRSRQRRGCYDDPDNIIKSDVVIVDEVSMCDVILMKQLLQKCLRGTRLILVGDIDQLPSVGAGNVLADIIGSGVVPVVRLTEIYRQTELSKIVTNAHAINHGNMPDISNKSSDFFFESAQSPADIKRKVISLVTERLPKYLSNSPFFKGGAPKGRGFSAGCAIQVLCPMKLGEAGMVSLNLALQEALNPPELKKPEYEYRDTVFRLGDRVMQTLNNYNQEWTRPPTVSVLRKKYAEPFLEQNASSGGETGTGIFNGDIGVITAVNRQNGEVTVSFEDGRVSVYTRSDLANLVLSYAITVHKSQGCEFDAVVIPVTSGAYMVLTRNLLYTAVTRARHLVMLVGSAENLQKMVDNTYTKQRFTCLREFLLEMQAKSELMFSTDMP